MQPGGNLENRDARLREIGDAELGLAFPATDVRRGKFADPHFARQPDAEHFGQVDQARISNVRLRDYSRCRAAIKAVPVAVIADVWIDDGTHENITNPADNSAAGRPVDDPATRNVLRGNRDVA